MRALLWPAGDAPGAIARVSPWVDFRFQSADEMAADIEAQTHHRRFLKTHSPADAIPFADAVKYIVVHRSAPDALVSWGNHRSKIRPEPMEIFNAAAVADGIAPLPTNWDGDYDLLFDEWSVHCSPVSHLGSWWPLRDEPNVLMLHYADMLADLEGEMRRIASFLDLEIDQELWPRVVDECRMDSMRDAARSSKDS